MGNNILSLRDISLYYNLYRQPKDRLKEALHPFRKKYHKRFYALQNVDLDVRQGQILGVVGKNGSGKSTLLKVISGVLTPSSGSVQVNGSIAAMLELGAGFNPEFSGLENIYFYGSILGFRRKEIDDRLEDILSFADIGDFIYQPLKVYSSGMKARLAFAVTVNIDPDILIVDEVLSVGDELFRRKCFARMENFIKSGKTIIFVSHNLPSILQFCNSALLVENGKITLQGAPKEVVAEYERRLFGAATNGRVAPQDASRGKSTNNRGEIEKICKKTVQKETCSADKAFFNPDLVPQSRMDYEKNGAEIFDICIRTLDDKKVNMLVMAEEYKYCYKVRFEEEYHDVFMGMKFKTLSGIELLGKVTPEDEAVRFAGKGEVFSVEWRFKNNLLPGTYFSNAGVSALEKEKRVFLHRIVDALAFKVQYAAEKNVSGFVNMELSADIHPFSDNNDKERR